MERVLCLRGQRDGRDSRSLWLRLSENGELTIEGQDLGPTVEKYWGGPEYEWDIRIKAADVAAYVRCLGGDSTEDVVDVVSACFECDPGCVEKQFLEKNGIPHEFWSRIGD
jgi:hypothetical protein